MKNFFKILACAMAVWACSPMGTDEPETDDETTGSEPMTLCELAKIFSELPMEPEHLKEVYDASVASSNRGYDEEYTLKNLLTAPGCGVGEEGTKAGETKAETYTNPLRNLLADCIAEHFSSKAGSRSAAAVLKALAESDYQLYFPFSEDWDGSTYPIITFDPGYGAESNYGYEVRVDGNGMRVVDSVYVDEAVAQRRPVWVLNTNDDSAFTPLELFVSSTASSAAGAGVGAAASACAIAIPGEEQEVDAASSGAGAAASACAIAAPAKIEELVDAAGSGIGAAASACAIAAPAKIEELVDAAQQHQPTFCASPLATHRKLMLKTFRMLRSYDSWFGGASEFFIKLGAVDGFTASTEAELKQYSPTVTDVMVVIRRRNVGKTMGYDSILLTDFTSQMEKLAFLVTEDDGGTRTSWKCEATVKVQSKSYGFSVDLPYNDKDDIVWRGQLTAEFFQEEDVVTGRFGDVVIQFELQ